MEKSDSELRREYKRLLNKIHKNVSYTGMTMSGDEMEELDPDQFEEGFSAWLED